MIKIHSLKLQTATETTVVPFDFPLSFPAAAAKMLEMNNQLQDPQSIYYMDNDCRLVAEDPKTESLWYPKTISKA